MSPAAHFILYVADQARSARFYAAVLGVTPRLDVPGMTEFNLPGGAVLGLMPEAAIERLLGAALPSPAAARGAPRAELYLVVETPGESHARALAAGATELSPLSPRSWGHLAAYSLDPDGHVVAFATPLGSTARDVRGDMRDRWAAGSTYEEFMGRWSRRLAPRFLSWLQAPRGAHWLDVGCGTGSLAEAICALADPASVVGCDPADPLLEFARERIPDARVSFVAAGVGGLPRRAGGYGAVTSLLALNFFPDPGAAVREMRSLAAAGGTVSACVWDYGDGMQFLRRFWDAAGALDPGARELDEGNRFPLCRRDALAALFRAGDLGDVRCEPIEIPTVFAGFDDFWRPFLGGTGPAPSYVASLDADRRATLARKLEAMLQREPDGTIALTARAWAVRGSVP